jgi:FAD:protein FMN transferase
VITVPAPRGALDDPGSGSVTWCSAGSTVHLAVTQPQLLRRAARVAARRLAAVERACLLPDGELARVNRAGGRTLRVSPALADVVAAALAVADRTGGDVDPVQPRTVAAPGERLSAIPTCAAFPPQRHRADRHDVRLDGCRLTLRAGARLDLRPVAAAVAADRCAAAVAAALDTGVLVGVAGATATAGPAPEGGWEQPGLRLPAGLAVSTSHARTSEPVDGEPVWLSATVLAFGAVEARAYSLAALVRGPAAPRWLTGLGVTARLVTVGGREVPVGDWDRAVTS